MKGLGADSKRQRVSEIKYIEFTYSPPKAVSVVAAVDDRVKGELYAAVKEELRWFEQQVEVRDRRGNLANEEVTKPTGKMIAALFQHETSRTNDPDFHVHTLIGNVTWDEERKGTSPFIMAGCSNSVKRSTRGFTTIWRLGWVAWAITSKRLRPVSA
jgi:conjugative relaxase-like TrwC/TraI family protein